MSVVTTKSLKPAKVFDCPVCFETIPESHNVTCLCGSKVCEDCCREYILSCSEEAHCMQCNVGWSAKFLLSNFNEKWLRSKKNGYKAHQMNIALDREKALIPETMLGVPEETKRREKGKLMADVMKNNILLKKDIETIKNGIRDGTSTDFIGDRKRIADIDKQIVSNRKMVMRIRRTETEPHPDRGSDFEDTYKVKFICACPIYGCRGMISSKKLKCAVCDIRICEDCREKIDHVADHECDKNTVESVKLMLSDSKPCPRCASSIFRISGCNQMFCTTCKIGFNWATGKISAGGIHNPHALEWIRTRGGPERDIRDIPCGGLPELLDIISLKTVMRLDSFVYPKLTGIYATIGEIDEKLGTCQRLMDRATLDKLRLSYIMGDFTEKTWKNRICSTEKLHAASKIQMNIYMSYRVIGIERFRDLGLSFQEYKSNISEGGDIFDLDIKLRETLRLFIQDMEQIRDFINETFISEFKWIDVSKSPQISQNWEWTA